MKRKIKLHENIIPNVCMYVTKRQTSDKNVAPE